MTLKLDLSEDPGEFRTPSDINVTPLVDVMLVLLVIFMITAPMLATGMKVTLPGSSSATPLEGVAPVIISIGDDSKIWVGLDEVRREDMIKVVERQVSGDKSRVLQLRGDTMARYGDVVFVMGELAKNGFNRIVVETDSKKGG